MALFGGHYVPCMFGLLPDKSGETYDRFFGMLFTYLDKNNLPNDFQNQFFMCDFEIAIRSSVMLYWPMVRLLGCFFHFSQVTQKNHETYHIRLSKLLYYSRLFGEESKRGVFKFAMRHMMGLMLLCGDALLYLLSRKKTLTKLLGSSTRELRILMRRS